MPEPLTIFACPEHPTQVRLDGLGRCPVRYSTRERCDLAFVPVRVLPEDDPRVLPEGMTRDHVRRLWEALRRILAEEPDRISSRHRAAQRVASDALHAFPAPPEWTDA